MVGFLAGGFLAVLVFKSRFVFLLSVKFRPVVVCVFARVEADVNNERAESKLRQLFAMHVRDCDPLEHSFTLSASQGRTQFLSKTFRC